MRYRKTAHEVDAWSVDELLNAPLEDGLPAAVRFAIELGLLSLSSDHVVARSSMGSESRAWPGDYIARAGSGEWFAYPGVLFRRLFEPCDADEVFTGAAGAGAELVAS